MLTLRAENGPQSPGQGATRYCGAGITQQASVRAVLARPGRLSMNGMRPCRPQLRAAQHAGSLADPGAQATQRRAQRLPALQRHGGCSRACSWTTRGMRCKS